MTDFARNVFPGEALLSLDTRAVLANSQYQSALKIHTESQRYTTAQLLAALDKALGRQITQLFLTVDRDTTVDIAGHVLEDHAREDHEPKDVQLNLLVNIIKEIVENKGHPRAALCHAAEDLLRRCVLDVDTKYAVKCALFDQQYLYNPMIVVIRHPPVLTVRASAA